MIKAKNGMAAVTFNDKLHKKSLWRGDQTLSLIIIAFTQETVREIERIRSIFDGFES